MTEAERRLEETQVFVRDRKTAYQLSFPEKAAHADMVLADLASFCRANESCVVPGDHDRTLLLEGRREVWLRIQQHLNLRPDQLMSLYTGKGIRT